MTFEQAAHLDPDEQPGELDQGRWVAVTRDTWRHGEICVNVAAILRQYARAHGGWSVATADPGTKLRRNPDVLRGPDVGIVRAERRPTGRGADGWLEGAPDVAVEVLGDDQSVSELARKAQEYLAAGAQMVGVVDPGPSSVVVFEPPNRFRVLSADDTLDGGDVGVRVRTLPSVGRADVLPEFSCVVRELFD
jgi:Uma2 family endonuclease